MNGFRTGIQVALLVAALTLPTIAVGQDQPKFVKFDRNQNGMLEQREIPKEARKTIKEFAKLANLDFKRPMPIKDLLVGYNKAKQGDSKQKQDSPTKDFVKNLPGFGSKERKSLVPGFGKFADEMSKITAKEWEFTVKYMKRADKNRNGILEREELHWWKDSQFNQWDLDKDGKVSIYEKALEGMHFQRGKRRNAREYEEDKIIEGFVVTLQDRKEAAYVITKYDKNQNGVIDRNEIPSDWVESGAYPRSDLNKDGALDMREYMRRVAEHRIENDARNKIWWNLTPEQRAIGGQCYNLAYEMIKRFDRNRNRALERSEWEKIQGKVGNADVNGNGYITRLELTD